MQEQLPEPFPLTIEKIEFNEVSISEVLDTLAAKLPDQNLVASQAASQAMVSLKARNISPMDALQLIADANGLWIRQNRKTNTVFLYTNAERANAPLDIETLESEINTAFPDSNVQLSTIGNKIVIRGEAIDTLEAEQILKTVAANTVTSDQTTPSPNSQLGFQLSRSAFGLDGSQSALGINGEVPLPQAIVPGEENVINLLKVPGAQQVTLRVIVAEVKRNAARNIGLNFQVNDNSGQGLFPLAGNAGDANTFSVPYSGFNIPVSLDSGQVQLAIKALRELSLARTIAEPSLTALNGQTASFHAGGQFPVPVVTGFTNSGLQGVSFVPFGCQLSFTPLIIDRNRIRLTLAGELSTRDASSAGTQVGGDAASGGTNIKDINTRNFETTVELKNGQTFAIAGLISAGYQAQGNRVPWLGDLPVVGRLAASDAAVHDETELVILVTPELVDGIDPHQQPPLPGADVFEPDDVEFFVHGQLESQYAEDYRSSVRTDFHRQTSARSTRENLLIGPVGYSDDAECISSESFHP
ncbi:MAG: hypothetical protein R3C28_33285 [Pirellulaceae bacterium]